MRAKRILPLGVLAIGIAIFGPTVGRSQTNVVADSATLAKLMKPANWADFPGGGQYYKFSTTAPLPSQTVQSWKVGSTTVKDLTRVGDGQCVDFVKKVSGTSDYSTDKWLKGLDVVDANNRIITMSGGTVIATFVNNKYSSEHCLVVLSRLANGDALIVAEQNVLTGKDQAKVVSTRTVQLASLKKYSIVQIKR